MFDNNTPTYLEGNAKHYIEKNPLLKVVHGHNKILVYDFATDQYSHYLDDAMRRYEVKTAERGRSQILPNGDLFVEESEFGRLLYFKADGSLLWSHVNRAQDTSAYASGWSRILYRDHEILPLVRRLPSTERPDLLAECKLAKAL